MSLDEKEAVFVRKPETIGPKFVAQGGQVKENTTRRNRLSCL